MIGQKIPYIVWKWKYTENQRTLRIVHASYTPKGDELRFHKDLIYEISAGYDALGVQQFNHATIKEFVEYIMRTTTYFDYHKILQSMITGLDNALSGYLKGRNK